MKATKKHMSKSSKHENIAAYLFIAPFMLGIFVFYVYAFIKNFYYSFTNKTSFGKESIIGFANYIKLFQSENFYSSLAHTAVYVLVCVPAVIIISIVIATVLNQKIKGIGVYRTLIYLPMVTLPTAIGLLWKWMFNAQYGLINGLLLNFGIKGPSWLSDSKVSLIAMCIVLIWSSVAQAVIIFLAGLQGISRSYYEASEIDGATAFQKFFRITLPLLSPTTFMMVIMEVIGFFQVFDLIYLMIPPTSSGMPGARSIVMLFYEESFQNYKKGYGAAISIVLFLIILVITMIQMKFQNRWVFQEEE